MDEITPQFLLATLITSLCLLAGCALGYWLVGSRAIRRKTPPAEPPIQLSDAHYASLRAEMAELYSTLEKLTTAVTRIGGRKAKQEQRERDRAADSEPPAGTSKADLFRHYGLSGKVGPDFHRAAQALEGKRNGGSE